MHSRTPATMGVNLVWRFPYVKYASPNTPASIPMNRDDADGIQCPGLQERRGHQVRELVPFRVQTLPLQRASHLVDRCSLRVRIEVRDERIRGLDHPEQACGVEVP